MNDTAFEKYKVDATIIVKHFDPLPTLMNKDYVFYLLFNSINPFNFYPKSKHYELGLIQDEVQWIIDDYKSYLEFKIFKNYSEKIRTENPHLYDLLVECNNINPRFNEVKVDDQDLADHELIKELEFRKFNNLI